MTEAGSGPIKCVWFAGYAGGHAHPTHTTMTMMRQKDLGRRITHTHTGTTKDAIMCMICGFLVCPLLFCCGALSANSMGTGKGNGRSGVGQDTHAVAVGGGVEV